MNTASTSLILKHVVGSASGAHGATTGNAARAAARAAVYAALHCEAVQRGLFALARGNPAHHRSTRPRFESFHHRACQDGAPPGEGKQPFPSKQGLHVRPRGLRTALGKPMGSAYALVASGNSSSSRSHAARTRPRPPSTDRNQVTFQATKVCHCGVFSCNFFLRGALGIPIRISLGTIGSM